MAVHAPRGWWLPHAPCSLLARTTRTQQNTPDVRRHTRRTKEGAFAHTRHVKIDGPRCCLCFLFFRKQSSVQKQRTTHEAGASTHAGRAQSRDTKKRIGLSGGVRGGGARPPLVVPAAGAISFCVVRCAVREGTLSGAFLVFGLCCSVLRKESAHSRAVRSA